MNPLKTNTMASTSPIKNINPNAGLAPGVTGSYDPKTTALTFNIPDKNLATQSTTALSSANPIKKIPEIVNTYNTLTDKSIKTSIQPDGTTVSTYANDEVYNPSVDPIVADTSKEEGTITADYEERKRQTDAQTASAITSIQNRYAELRRKQKQINESTLGATTTALISSGALKGDVYADDSIKLRMEQGNQELTDLENEEDSLIQTAKAAQLANNFKLLDAKNAEIQKIRDEKAIVTKGINDYLIKATESAREKETQSRNENAISELYTSGVSSVPEILSALKANGFSNITSKDVSDFLKTSGLEDINKISLEASKNGAPLDIIQKIGQARSVQEAIELAEEYTQKPQDPLDIAYKKAQLAKIYQEIADSKVAASVGSDPSALIAYAQQYAADGKIPAGIPKGSFGVIAQVAKELPKQKGQIIDSATGVAPTGDTTLSTAMASLSSVVDLAKQLKELDKERIGGLVAGSLGAVFGSNDQQRYLDLRSQIIDLLSRARSGAALTTSEEKRYGDMLPGRFSEPLGTGVNSDVRIDNFIKNISSDLENKAKAKGWTIYGVSTVDTSAGKRTVGETVVLPNGVSGRINADGTVTIIQ